jgi:hypothetical protein
MFVGSTAGGATIALANALRAQLTVQPLTDAFRIGPVGSLTGSSGLFVASGVVQVLPAHTGLLYALPNGGATAALAIWESQISG